MKKILRFAFVVSVLTVFTACSLFSDKYADVELVTFYVQDGNTIEKQFYSETKIVLEPDSEMRTLKVDYQRDFPERTEETNAQDVKQDGVLGGVFYDSYLEVMDFLDGKTEEDFKGAKADDDGHLGVLAIVVERAGDVKVEYDLSLVQEREDIEFINLLVADLATVFTEDVY